MKSVKFRIVLGKVFGYDIRSLPVAQREGQNLQII